MEGLLVPAPLPVSAAGWAPWLAWSVRRCTCVG